MKRGTPRHPKTYALAEYLSIPLYSAVGILEMMWHHAAQVTPMGDLGSIPDKAIAAAIDWAKKPELLVDGLIACGWLNVHDSCRFYIHDWPTHCEQSVIKFLEYNHKDFLPIYGVSLENRKRKSRVSLPSRVAMAMAEAKGIQKEKKDEAEMTPALDEQFQEFKRLYEAVGNPIDEDFSGMSFCWKAWNGLDFPQKCAVVESLRVRQAAGVMVLHKPDNYLLKNEWKRKIQQRRNGSGNSAAELAAL